MNGGVGLSVLWLSVFCFFLFSFLFFSLFLSIFIFFSLTHTIVFTYECVCARVRTRVGLLICGSVDEKEKQREEDNISDMKMLL